MKTYEYGNPDADIILIQPVDDHDLSVIENEVRLISSSAGDKFCLVAVKVDDWNRDLPPWTAPAVFKNEDFGDGASATLSHIMKIADQSHGSCIIGGYSLAGLFALWAAYQTDAFAGVAAASPSVWFPGWADYMKTHTIRSSTVYLSLGDKEEKTRNPVMASVGKCIRDGYDHLKNEGADCILEWNSGNHFKEPDLRMAKAFSWVIKRLPLR